MISAQTGLDNLHILPQDVCRCGNTVRNTLTLPIRNISACQICSSALCSYICPLFQISICCSVVVCCCLCAVRCNLCFIHLLLHGHGNICLPLFVLTDGDTTVINNKQELIHCALFKLYVMLPIVFNSLTVRTKLLDVPPPPGGWLQYNTYKDPVPQTFKSASEILRC